MRFAQCIAVIDRTVKAWISIFFTVSLLLTQNSGFSDIIPPGRRVAWQGNVGVEGGIPAGWLTFCNVALSIPGTNIVAVGDGVSNALPALAAAFQRCPPNQVIYIPAGIYVITNSTPFSLGNRSGVIIRGAGLGQTVLKFYGSTGLQWYLSQGVKYENAIAFNGTDPALPIGATSVNLVGSVSHLSAGRYAILDQIDDGNLVNPQGVEGNWGAAGSTHAPNRMLQQIVKILSVSGSTVTFSPPCQWNYTNSLAPMLFAWDSTYANMYEWFGIEDLTVENHGNLDYTLDFHRVANWWLKNVEISNGSTADLYLVNSYRGEVRGCYFHDTSYLTPGGGYGFEMQIGSTGNLIENNVFAKKRVPMMCEGGSGNVIAYNYSVANVNYINAVQKNPSVHACYPKMNLFEGNVGNRMGGDNTHGSSGYNTFFRNWGTANNPNMTVPTYQWSVTVDQKALCYNFVGNILGFSGISGVYQSENSPRFSSTPYIWSLGYVTDGDGDAWGNDPNVLLTTLRHGNYDFINRTTIWDPGISDHTIPASLYLTTRPSWWNSSAWPPFGPDVTGLVSTLPAQDRYQLYASGLLAPPPVSPVRPSSPVNLRIVP